MRHVALGPGAEFDAVRRILVRWGDLAVGIGSDAAVLDVPAGHQLVVSTDTSVEGVHFRREWLAPVEVGYRATTAALSDLAAAAAAPLGVLVALAIPSDWRAALEGLADGIGEAVRVAGARIVGGDLTGGPALSLSMTVLGAAAHPLSRVGAEAGQIVYVTGRLGGPGAAIAAWRAGRQPHGEIRARFAHPGARVREAEWLAARGATAAIDISDGLTADLQHLAAASRVRLTLRLDAIPCLDGVTAKDAMRSGEEYELAVTAPSGLDAQAFSGTFGIPLTAVGSVSPSDETESGVEVIDARGIRVDPPRGYDHFSG